MRSIRRILFVHFPRAVKGGDADYTTGDIRRAIFYLAIPMMLEMIMESLFAIVDIFFVGKLGVDAVAAVGLTESVLSIVYSVSIGLSMAATAVVARRIGEKQFDKASEGAFQSIFLGVVVAVIIGVVGFVFAGQILRVMGATDSIIEIGKPFTRIIFAGNVTVTLLFLVNGIFRGAGNAALAMRSIWLANGINIILDPILIFGLGPIEGMGVVGAAWATTIGRGVGVLYQLYHLFNGKHLIKIGIEHMKLNVFVLFRLIKISSGGMGQFLIESASWIFLMKLVAEDGAAALAGYTIAVRIFIFTLLPAFGLSNAAATLVGQNLGAAQPQRAERSVWLAAHGNALYLGICMLGFIIFGDGLIALFNSQPEAVAVGTEALSIVALGYVFFAYGMVISQSFNGAGDTFTPTAINVAMFWFVEIPLAYFLAQELNLGATGVFYSIAFAHSLHAVVSYLAFRRGRWKKTVV